MKRHCIIFLLFVICYSAYSQKTERIKPGKMYEEGSEIESPRYGFKGVIPNGWVGMLPQGTEIFMLNKKNGTSGEVLLFARPDGDLSELTSNWKEGAALTDAIFLRAEGEVVEEGDMIYAEIMEEGERINTNQRGFIVGRCGEYGPCITMLMITPGQFYDKVRDEMLEFMRESEFTEPSNRTPYENFDWKSFLDNKVLVTYNMEAGGKRQNMIHLCADGSFQTIIKQSGFLRQDNKAYMGKNKGSWSVEGSGPETVVSLTFDKDKVPPLKMVLSIRDEEIYANDIRYYAGYSDYCE